MQEILFQWRVWNRIPFYKCINIGRGEVVICLILVIQEIEDEQLEIHKIEI